MELYTKADNIELNVYNTLKEVIDPELAINIIDLGLVYKIHYDHSSGIHIQMTLSNKGCPMGDVITENIRSILSERFPNFKSTIELIWEPIWSSEFVSPHGRTLLGLA